MCFERLLQAFARWQPGILFDIAAQPILEHRWIDSYSVFTTVPANTVQSCNCLFDSHPVAVFMFDRTDWYPMYYPKGMKSRVSPWCPRTVWSWILRKRNSSGWAVDNSFEGWRRSHSSRQPCCYFPVHFSGFILTANWQWRFMCSISARHHSTSSDSSCPCVARSPLMHVQPLYMHSMQQAWLL